MADEKRDQRQDNLLDLPEWVDGKKIDEAAFCRDFWRATP